MALWDMDLLNELSAITLALNPFSPQLGTVHVDFTEVSWNKNASQVLRTEFQTASPIKG